MALPPRNQPGALPARPAGGPAPRAAGPQPAPTAARVDWSDPNRRASLVRRGEESNKNKDGATRRGLLDDGKLQLHNIKLWPFTVGKKYWAIIPYLTGPQDPMVYQGKLQEGDGTYTVGVYFHRVGQNGMDKVICLAKTYGLPCPICEYREELDRDPNADEATIKSLLPSKYMTFLYYILDWDAESKGLQVAMISGMFFEQALQTQAYSSRGGGYIPFMDPGAGPDGGRDIEFEIRGSIQKQDWGRGVGFRERQQPIPPRYLDEAAALPLDELLRVPSYEEVYELFHQGHPPEQGEAAPGQTQHYECFRTGQYGAFQDCITSCPDVDECKAAGSAPGYDDIPSDLVHQPQPGPEQAPAAAAVQPPGQPAPAGPPVGGKPPLLRRGAQ